MTEQGARESVKIDWLLVGLLFLLVLPLRLWLLHNTEVTARDSIGYIRYALRFEHQPWQEVLQTSQQHPGYPLLVWLTSVPIRWLDGETTPENMQLGTQLVSFVASLLLLLPMYFLGRQFFDAKVCFWAVLLYQYLPISAQHLSDGISEPAYLFFLTSALWQSVLAVRQRTLLCCALCGAFTGTAYLIRPEGLLVLPAFMLALMVLQCRPEWRCSWRQFFAAGTVTTLCAALIGAAYVATIGGITNKPSARQTIGNSIKIISQLSAPSQPSLETRDASLVMATVFPRTDNTALRLQRSVWALLSELNQGFHYVASVPALLGLWWSFAPLGRKPGFWMPMSFTLLHSFILLSLAMTVCYVSDRHVMIFVLGGCFFVVVGLQEMARRLFVWCQVAAAGPDASWTKTWWRSATVWFVVLYAALIGFCLPKATQRLHGSRVGNHLAGVWLHDHLAEGDVITDDHSWTHYFAGLVFKENEVAVYPKDFQAKCYVVVTRSREQQVDSQRQTELAKDAVPIYAWPALSDLEHARVVVYVQRRDPLKNPWHCSSP